MPTPYQSPLTEAQLSALTSTTIGNAKPYQLKQILETLERVKWERGGNADVSVQPTISTILSSNLGGSVNP